ncbi:MAG: CRISPR-associated endonuclease Cas1 [Oscillospiraceae bacterium]|nr:CRISPR-associated endonuclease Cas1 [Oscillospiraceae bacterium]
MRKLLNTVYITQEKAYLTLDGENLVCLMENSEKFRIPFDNVEAIVCFSYIGCSPALMGKCAEKLIPITFLTPNGKFLAKVSGETRGNVFLRVAQIERFQEKGLALAQSTMAAKFCNCINLIRRSRHDIPALREDADIDAVTDMLRQGVDKAYLTDSVEELLGIEGNCARAYFSVFGKLFTGKDISFEYRSKRPPLDPVNAVLSFLYTLYTNEFAAALETVGIDSYIGYCHTLRSGRSSLACDLVEEARCHVERMTITLFNLGILTNRDFDTQVSGAVWLNDEGRRKVLTKWQEKKRGDLQHPYLKQKIQFGLLPYVQSNLLAKYLRGELSEYPNYIYR